jgi:NitT/TauT family transport system permease protein
MSENEHTKIKLIEGIAVTEDVMLSNSDSTERTDSIFKEIADMMVRLRQHSLAIVIFLVLWEILPRTGVIERVYLPPISEVFRALWGLARKGVLFKHIYISLLRSFRGFGLSILVGIPLGLMIGWNVNFKRSVDPLLQVFRQTSPLALLPVFILFFGIGETTKTVIVFWGSLWPILMNTITGVRNTPPLLVKMARSMGESQIGLICNIILPSASPDIFAGLKVSASTSLVMLTAAEMVGANSGIGYLILYSQQVFRVADLYAALITVAVIGVLLNFAITKLERATLHWREALPE